jgi:hypothetical protein
VGLGKGICSDLIGQLTDPESSDEEAYFVFLLLLSQGLQTLHLVGDLSCIKELGLFREAVEEYAIVDQPGTVAPMRMPDAGIINVRELVLEDTSFNRDNRTYSVDDLKVLYALPNLRTMETDSLGYTRIEYR